MLKFQKFYIISGENYHHLKNVLRKRANDVIFVIDGNGCKYKAKISLITRDKIFAKPSAREFISPENGYDLTLAFVPLKGFGKSSY